MVPTIPMWLYGAHYEAPAGSFRGSALGFAAGIALTFAQDPESNDIGLLGNWDAASEDGFRLAWSTLANQSQLELELGQDTGGSALFTAANVHLLGTTRFLVINMGAGADAAVELWMNGFKIIDTTLGVGDSYQPAPLASFLEVGNTDGSTGVPVPAQFGVHGAFYMGRTLTPSEIATAYATFAQTGNIAINTFSGPANAVYFDNAWDRQGLLLPGQAKVSPDTWAPSAQSGAVSLTQSAAPGFNNLSSAKLNSLGG